MNDHRFPATTAEAVAKPVPSDGGEPTSTHPAVPKREFGRSGVRISKLCLGGGSLAGANSRALLDEALKYGVDCWEIVSFAGSAYSEYFRQHPEIRERVFLSGKVYSPKLAVMQEQLERVLTDNGTSFLDFLAIHVLDNLDVLTADVRRWVEALKRQKKIRFFGFCTHKSMPKCLSGAAELGWIDGIQTVYNYRQQTDQAMEDALHKCHDKGIGIFAIKSMGLCVRPETGAHSLPAGHEISFEQAKLKAIWQNPNVTAVCSLMPSLAILQSNAFAALDEHPLDAQLKTWLADHAQSTGRYFCRRCGACDAASPDAIPIFAIMELLMYARRYGMGEFARKRFAELPGEVRNKIAGSDYSMAERGCPQKMPIAQLMKQACEELSNQ